MPRDSSGRRYPPDGNGAPHNNGPELRVTHRIRRAAALRMPPFGDGPVDPLDDIAGAPIGKPHLCYGVEFIAGGRVKPCCRKGRTGAP